MELPVRHADPQVRPGAGRGLHRGRPSPPSQTPLSALALAELCEQVGIPAGVVNIVHGLRRRARGGHGHRLAQTKIRKESASPARPRSAGSSCAELHQQDIKRVSIELGGNAPFVVLGDANLDAAVRRRVVAKSVTGARRAPRRTGSSCTRRSRTSSPRPSGGPAGRSRGRSWPRRRHRSRAAGQRGHQVTRSASWWRARPVTAPRVRDRRAARRTGAATSTCPRCSIEVPTDAAHPAPRRSSGRSRPS